MVFRLEPPLAVVAVAGLISALMSCSPTPSKSSSPPPLPTPAASRLCTGRAGEEPLRGFFRDLSNDRPVKEVLAAYVVPPQDFVRWWDGTLRLGQTLTFSSGLEQHLDRLQQNGMDVTVTGFKDVGFDGRGTRDEGGWFNFGLRGRLLRSEPLMSEQSLGGHKGAVDCGTGKLKVVVI